MDQQQNIDTKSYELVLTEKQIQASTFLSKNQVLFTCYDGKYILNKRYKNFESQGYEHHLGYSVGATDVQTSQNVQIRKYYLNRNLNELKEHLLDLMLSRFFRHDAILRIVNVEKFNKELTDKVNLLLIIYEPMETTLDGIIRSAQLLSNEHIQYFTYQILRAYKYIHSANVIQYNLSPFQIFVNSNCDLKLARFNNSKNPLQNNKLQKHQNYYLYQAPEIHFNYNKISYSADIWSCGVIMAELIMRRKLIQSKDFLNELITRVFPYVGAPEIEDLFIVSDPIIKQNMLNFTMKNKLSWNEILPLNTDPNAIDLLSKMLVFNPEKRISAEDCLKHPYFTQLYYPIDEPISDEQFDWNEFDNLKTEQQVLKQIYTEYLYLNSD